jgi:hypothetical protein
MSMRVLLVGLAAVTALLAAGFYVALERGLIVEAIAAGAVLVWVLTGRPGAPSGGSGDCGGCGCGGD